jgi:hypothetical protein
MKTPLPAPVPTVCTLLLALSTAFGVSACHGDDNGAGATATTATVSLLAAGDLCRYITAEDAAAALGGPAQKVPQPDAVNTAGTIVETCAYTNSAGAASVLFRRSNAEASRAAFRAAQSATPGAVEVPGVGEEAFYNPPLGQLVVRQKDMYFIVTIGSASTVPPPAPSEALKQLGSRIAARI